jgi:hypothetical protein
VEQYIKWAVIGLVLFVIVHRMRTKGKMKRPQRITAAQKVTGPTFVIGRMGDDFMPFTGTTTF